MHRILAWRTYRLKFALLFVSALSGCQAATPDEVAKAENDFCRSSDQYCSPKRGVAVEEDKAVRYKPKAKGQPVIALSDLAQKFLRKKEFETTDEYKKRIERLPKVIEDEF